MNMSGEAMMKTRERTWIRGSEKELSMCELLVWFYIKDEVEIILFRRLRGTADG